MARPKRNRQSPARRIEVESNRPSSRRPLPQASDRRERNWALWAWLSLAAVATVAFIVLMVVGFSGELRGTPDGVADVPVGDPLHVEGDIDYEGHPAGGEHSAVWLNCGFYPEPVPEENAVHSLEHGAVWITYPADAPQATVDELSPHADRLKVIVSPVEGQTIPVLMTAWGNQLEVENADDPRIDQFITAFVSGGDAPEPGGACTGGLGQPA